MLRIICRRADGYHNLQTSFQLLDWGDEINIKQFDCDTPNNIKISGFDGLEIEQNLIYKASQLLLPYAQSKSSWNIAVEKKIPMGAGLGGGSSNAAIVLKFLNEYWQCGLSKNELNNVGVSLGADVPIFLLGESAVASGVGDKLQITSFNTPYILLLLPNCNISTGEMFRYQGLQRKQEELSERYLNDQTFWINDFFPAVLETKPEIKTIYQQLKHSFDIRLSGTGSTLFVIFNTRDQAMNAFELSKNLCHTVIAKPLIGFTQ